MGSRLMTRQESMSSPSMIRKSSSSWPMFSWFTTVVTCTARKALSSIRFWMPRMARS